MCFSSVVWCVNSICDTLRSHCNCSSLVFCFFFIFKQKTAYEMRMSDWSSDVCSSDLRLDGITLDLGNDTWMNVRTSNTEPVLRLNAEAKDKTALDSDRKSVV